MGLLVVAVIGLLAVAATAAVAPRIRIAAPLLLVVIGIGVSFLPFVPPIEIDPEWVLAGVLPPLLYSSAVSMPAMNFRREFRAIGGLSVALVVISSIVLGFFFHLIIPGLDLGWGIALGAIVSPTDAVATSIVKRVGVSGRVVSVLEGESLLNDATALVLLRYAIAASGAAVSLWSVVGTFAYSVAVAVAFGIVVGWLNLLVRSKITDSTVNTVISFAIPFLASIPAEALGASGLVAAVIAGLVTGHGAARRLPPQHRLAEAQNWRAIELILEGAIFLVMGLELFGIVAEVQKQHANLGAAFVIGGFALILTLIVRAAYLTPLLAGLRRHARRSERSRPRYDALQQRLDDPTETWTRPGSKRSGPSPRRLEQFRIRLRRGSADIDYLVAAPLGWREGSVLVWAGMRGAVTVAAAQTLPPETPHRSLLVLIAFTVAAASLIIQGSSLGAFVSWIHPAVPDPQTERDERRHILLLLKNVADETQAGFAPALTMTLDPAPGAGGPSPLDGEDLSNAAQDPSDATPTWPSESGLAAYAEAKRRALSIIAAQRSALLDARDDGVFSAEALNGALMNLDADQISIELKGDPAE